MAFTPRFPENLLVGFSQPIKVISAEIERAARSDAKVLITGETGVGKEVVARLIHQRSARALAPFVPVNCAGLPDSLLESELFGYVRGSFTGAYRDKPGLLELAPNGTVFLDEVGEMTPRMQVVLLRFLETGEIQRIGSERTHARVDVRLIAATNRDLPEHMVSGAFREDLYFRLNVINVCIPPLRERPEDIPVLVDHFLDMYCQQHGASRVQISDAAMNRLVGYRWPGNVRELKNVVERLVVKADGRLMEPSDLPPEVLMPPATSDAAPAAARPVQRTLVDDLIARMLNRGESFWTVVYPLYMAHDLTRNDLRHIVETGLERSNGSYRVVVRLFNIPFDDYKKFLSFLCKHDCHLPFQRFRVPSAAVKARIDAREAVATDPLRKIG